MDNRLFRSEIIAEIRSFFRSSQFIEVDTPSFVLSPGMEPHIRPIKVGEAFLPTSPEFAMKRILSLGYERLFQVCKAYRLEPRSATHNPEFTILEWYRAHSGFEAIMDDVENLFVSLARRVHGSTVFETSAHGRQNVERPWPRLTIEECFRRFAGLELTKLGEKTDLARACVENGWASKSDEGTWDDFFFRVMLNAVEPGLARLGTPVIVYLYPESQAALSNLMTDARGFRWAKRFEVYAGGLELGNAFDELADPIEQRKRFEKDMRLRQELYGPDFQPNPIDEEFLAALGRMPPSGGIAMGVDRIVMYFTGATDIKDVLWLPSYWP